MTLNKRYDKRLAVLEAKAAPKSGAYREYIRAVVGAAWDGKQSDPETLAGLERQFTPVERAIFNELNRGLDKAYGDE